MTLLPSEQLAKNSSRPAPNAHEVNGWRVLASASQANEIAALAAFVPGGASRDPEGKAGALSLALAAMQKGTKRRKAREYAEAVEDLGSSVGGSCVDDYAKWSMASSSASFGETLDLWAEGLLEPAFDADEVAKERDLALAGLRMRDDNTFSFTYQRFVRELYRGTAYAEPSDGTIESVGKLEAADLAARHAALVETGGGLVVAVGNFDEKRLLRRLADILPAPARPAPARLAVKAQAPPAEALVVEKESEQGFLCVGAANVPYDHPDYEALRVLCAVLGEGMGSRMFIRLRDEKGLAYDTGASLSQRRELGHALLYIGTQPNRVEEALAGMLAIVEEIRRVPPTAEELRRAKNYILGHFLFGHQKNSRRANYLGFYEMMGVGCARDAEFPSRVEAVTAERVRDAAERHLANLLAVKLRALPPTGASAPADDDDSADDEA